MSDDFLSRLAEKEDGRRGGGRVELDNPVRASAGARVRTAYPRSRRAGKFVRVSATLLPETVEELEGIRRGLAAEAERLTGVVDGVHLTDVIRMMVTAGMDAWRDGVLETEVESVAAEPRVVVRAKM